MAHIHSVTDPDKHFIIDAAGKITCAAEDLPQLKQGMHNAEVITLEIPRSFENHDISACNRVTVQYINIEAAESQYSSKQNTNKDAYLVEDLAVSETDENTLVFSWLVSDQATKYSGTLNFCVWFECISDDGVVEYSLPTDIFESLPVSATINNMNDIAERNADILAQWKAEITAQLHTHSNKSVLDWFHCEAVENDSSVTLGQTNSSDLTFGGSALRYMKDGAVIKEMEEVTDESGNKFLRLYLHWSNGVILVGQHEFVDIPISQITEKEVEVENSSGLIIGNSTGLELELPTDGSSHEHENKGVLDQIKNNNGLYFGNNRIWINRDGSVISNIVKGENGTVNLTVKYDAGDTENLEFVTPEYVTAAINGSLDEVEALIDESGVLDE